MSLPTEKHPFPAYYPKTCKFLFVGSFPPIKLTEKIAENISALDVKSLYDNYLGNIRNSITNDDILFYYGSRDNLLWQKVIGPIFKTEFGSKQDIIAFLDLHCIGITDVCEEVSRKIINGKISSKDEHLNIHKNRDITSIIKEKRIEGIFSTSEWVTNKVRIQLSESNMSQGIVDIYTLTSPSKMASRSIGKHPEYKQLKESNIIKNTIDYRQLKYIDILKTIVHKV